MDLESTYLVVGVLVISAAILLIIDYLFKNKSYEEVVAEQMQQNRALYASQHRPKVKDKKQKKVAKKVKEKKSNSPKDSAAEDATTDGHETAESQTESVESHKHHHVEFKEPAELEEDIKEAPVIKKKVKRDSATMRPILINKEAPSEMVHSDSEAPASNHFEELHPKDELEMLCCSKEEATKDKKKNKQPQPAAVVEQEPTKNKKATKQQQPAEPAPKVEEKKEEEKPEPIIAPPVVVPPITNGVQPVKEKKKKKHDGAFAFNGDKQGITLTELIPLVRKADISRVEVQNLIDILLNKQQDAPVTDEWSEGKGDPVQKLKKQLADKEKQIVELQETLTGRDLKIKEVRAEQTTERSHLTQTVRELEEAIKAAKIEKQTLDGRLQNTTIKCQQLQDQYNEEAIKSRKILDEYTNLKMQKQQMEMHLSQVQEAEVTIAQLRNELQELQNRRTIENHAAMEHNMIQVKQLQHQISTLKEDMDKKDLRNRELKEINTTMESRLSLLLRQEEELKSENAKVKGDLQRSVEEMRRLEHSKVQELQMVLTNTKDELEQEQSKFVLEIQKLKTDLAALKQEKTSADQDNSRLKDELKKLNDSVDSVKKENSKLKEEAKSMQDAKVNGLIEDKQQVSQLQSELANVKSQVQKLEEAHKLQVQKLEEGHERTVGELKSQHTKELEEQKNKNNELRQKNWKVVEALNAAESRVKSAEKQSKVVSSTSNTQTDELQTKAMFIQRLFADHKELKSLPQDKCEALLKTFIEDYTQQNKNRSKEEKSDKAEDNEEVSQLKLQLEEYKKMITETDSLLSRLQADVKKAEIRWRDELKDKDDHINQLTEMLSSGKKTLNSINNDEGICQNDCTNGPGSVLNDLSGSTNSSAASSIVDLPLKKKKKNNRK